MARRVKPKIKYKKNKKAPKAYVGAAVQAGLAIGKTVSGMVQRRRAKKAEEAFDEGRLERGVSKATQKMADQPIDQSYIEGMKQQQGADRASAMGALSKDPRNILAGVQGLQGSARKQRTELLGMQQDAKTAAMQNLAKEQQAVEDQRIKIAEDEISGIKAEKAAATQNIYGGLEDLGSAAASAFPSSGGGTSGGSVGSIPKPTLGTPAPITQGVRLPGNFSQSSSGTGTTPQPLFSGMSVNQGDRAFKNTKLSFEEGGKIDEDGGVTPGEFDHNTNPIDMVQDGEKVGEATGGELVLPPDDVEDIRMALKDGDKETAFKLMEDLVAKYDENVIGEDNDSEAQDGGKVKNAVDKKRASEIMKAMNDSSQEVRNMGELPFDPDPTITPDDAAEINFIDKYRKSLVKKEGRTDSPKMKSGGYMSGVKSKLSSLFADKLKS